MLELLATAGGFGGTYDARPPALALAPDAVPKLVLIAALLLVLVAWLRFRLRSLSR